MAFRVLSSEELELLTENQRKSYEEELAFYNERVKFVEQLERFENMEIAPYKPRFPVIPKIEKAPGQEFVKPEYGFLKFTHPKRPECQVETICIGGPQKPVLPPVVKISIPDSTFKETETVSPSLPLVEKPENVTGLFFTPVTAGPSVMVKKHLKSTVPVVEAFAFLTSEYTVPMPKKPAVEIPGIKIPKTAGKLSIALPEAVIPGQVDILWRPVGERRAEVPKVLDAPVVNVMFCGPNIQKTELPEIPKAVIPTEKFHKPEYKVSDLPLVQVPKADISQFTVPKPGKSVLPAIMKPDRIPKLYGTRSVNHTPEIEHPSIHVLSVQPMKRVYARAGGLPVPCSVTLPDVHTEELLEILLPQQRKNEPVEESFA